MRSFKSTLIFAAIVGVVLFYAIFESKRGEELKEVEAKKDRIINIESKDLNEMVIERSEDILKIIHSEDDKWKIDSPVHDRADEFLTSSYLDSILEQKAKPIDEEVTDWSQYGLDNPLQKLKILTKSNKEINLEFGSEKAFDGSYFIRKDGKLYIGESQWNNLLSKKSQDLREKSLFFNTAEVNSIMRINDKNKKEIDLQKDKETGLWKILNHPKWLVDNQTVVDLTTELKDLKATEFLAEDTEMDVLKHYGLDRPLGTLEIGFEQSEGETKGDSKWWLKYSKDKKTNDYFVYYVGRPTVYKVAASSLEKILKPVEDFRDKKFPFKFEKNEINKIELSSKTDKLDLQFEKKNGIWELQTPVEGMEIDISKVEGLVSKMNDMKVSQFYSDSMKSKLDKGVIKLKSSDDKELFNFTWGGVLKSKNTVLAKSNLSEELFEIEKTTLDQMQLNSLLKKVEVKKEETSDPLKPQEDKK